jgi:PAT family beta-lactamase induction signal transducer AmpG
MSGSGAGGTGGGAEPASHARPAGGAPRRVGTLESLSFVVTSRRTAAVTLQSFFSGLPLGLIWIAVPAWMARVGIDIRTIGILTLAQSPWTFKFLWSPLMDRYAPPILGRKRGWALVGQAGLLLTTAALALAAADPRSGLALGGASFEWVWVAGALCLAIAFASTVQDIAIDAYAVEVLRPEEHGIAVGARTALYRLGMTLAGAVAITVAAFISWQTTLLILAGLYLAAMAVTALSPEPEEAAARPPRTLRAAVWEPLVGLLAQRRALELAAFVLLYKFGDNLSYALVRPFLVQQGYDDVDVGVATGTIGVVGNVAGAFLGGILTTRLGLGNALWLFGFLQAASNLGYVWIAGLGVSRPAMYLAMAVETGTTGLGTGAFGVLLLRLTQKRFSATQYALLSSVFALGRVATGPMAGILVDALGWRSFFVLSIAAAAPGLIFLQRFVPLGSAEPVIAPEAVAPDRPISRAGLAARGAAGAAAGLLAAALIAGSLQAVKAYRSAPEAGFRLAEAVSSLARPETAAAWTDAAGVVLVGVFTGLATAAYVAARRGVERR